VKEEMRGIPGKYVNGNEVYLGSGISHIETQLIDETQLLEFVDDICKSLQESQQTDILILDFAKAFDKVNHAQTAALWYYRKISQVDGKLACKQKTICSK
jgi:hypothetical protein